MDLDTRIRKLARAVKYCKPYECEKYKEIAEQLELLVELKAARIQLQKIERIAREAFSNPDTQDINLYRAQALANIFAVFEYHGATIGVEVEDQDKTEIIIKKEEA